MAKVRYVGIDEVGRGPLAGPVTVCVCATKPSFNTGMLQGVTDSKKMTQKSREEWSQKLHSMRRRGQIEFVVVSVSARAIDQQGITKSIQRAMGTALRKLDLNASQSEIFLDGSLRAPHKFTNQETIIGGDGKHVLISAASVIAKVHRDTLMSRLGKKYPRYVFEKHKGYGTKEHRVMIQQYGMSPEHRVSFCGNIH